MLSYQSYTVNNIHELPQYDCISPEQLYAIKVVSEVYPFRVNSHVAENLIDWSNIPDDPLFRLTFPQAGMLSGDDYMMLSDLVASNADPGFIREEARKIQLMQNPNPAGQMELNTPWLDDEPLHGMLHKYRESVRFFPFEAQVCLAYCTYCFRWPQFSGQENLKFANHSIDRLVEYLEQHPEAKDVIFTNGDPMVMSTLLVKKYIRLLLGVSTLKTIRIGTKSLSWWPQRYTAESDADELLHFFEEIVASGRHLAIMAHISHSREIASPEAAEAIRRIRSSGEVIRSQSPVVRHVNDDSGVWQEMWQQQVQLGIIPYYMFVERDTGPKHYFEVPLAEALDIYNGAYQQMSGLGRTVRGPSMFCSPGKVIVEGVAEINDEKVFVLKFTQSRNPEWTNKTFLAGFDENASWIDDLAPAFGEDSFFFEPELMRRYSN